MVEGHRFKPRLPENFVCSPQQKLNFKPVTEQCFVATLWINLVWGERTKKKPGPGTTQLLTLVPFYCFVYWRLVQPHVPVQCGGMLFEKPFVCLVLWWQCCNILGSNLMSMIVITMFQDCWRESASSVLLYVLLLVCHSPLHNGSYAHSPHLTSYTGFSLSSSLNWPCSVLFTDTSLKFDRTGKWYFPKKDDYLSGTLWLLSVKENATCGHLEP